MCENEKAQDQVLKELNDIGKKNGFKGMELLQTVILTSCVRTLGCFSDARSEEWTPQNGLLSAASHSLNELTLHSAGTEASAQGDHHQVRR